MVAALVGLERLGKARLLRSGSGGYLVAHDRIRDVVYTEAGEERRRIYHGRALDLLTKKKAAAAAV